MECGSPSLPRNLATCEAMKHKGACSRRPMNSPCTGRPWGRDHCTVGQSLKYRAVRTSVSDFGCPLKRLLRNDCMSRDALADWPLKGVSFAKPFWPPIAVLQGEIDLAAT